MLRKDLDQRYCISNKNLHSHRVFQQHPLKIMAVLQKQAVNL